MYEMIPKSGGDPNRDLEIESDLQGLLRSILQGSKKYWPCRFVPNSSVTLSIAGVPVT